MTLYFVRAIVVLFFAGVLSGCVSAPPITAGAAPNLDLSTAVFYDNGQTYPAPVSSLEEGGFVCRRFYAPAPKKWEKAILCVPREVSFGAFMARVGVADDIPLKCRFRGNRGFGMKHYDCLPRRP